MMKPKELPRWTSKAQTPGVKNKEKWEKINGIKIETKL